MQVLVTMSWSPFPWRDRRVPSIKSKHNWHLRPESFTLILKNFVHLCCTGLISGSKYSWLHTSQLCRQHDRVHSVLLIVQPQECADDAGFTLVQSHCCTLPSGPVRLSCLPSAIFTHYILQSLSVMQSFWGPRQYWYYQEKNRSATARRNLINKSSEWLVRAALLTYMPHRWRRSGS